MDLQHQYGQVSNMGQWHVWRLGLDMAEFQEEIPPQLPENMLEELHSAQLSLYRFFQDMLADLYSQPNLYGIPEDRCEALSTGDKNQEDRIREARLKVRKAIEVGILDFIYRLGQAGDVYGHVLKVPRSFYDQLAAEKIKKTKNKAFIKVIERLGFAFTMGDEVVVSNDKYPFMIMALSNFARECSKIKDYDFYFFRRCDFGVFAQKHLPAFEDVLRLVPEGMRNDVLETDALLRDRTFKREIFVSDAGSGYRLCYKKKNDTIVYWSRLMNSYFSDLNHNLRWEFDTDLTTRLFLKLDGCKPNLSGKVFKGIKKCTHCYEPCMARVSIECSDQKKECCKEAGWDAIGDYPVDFSDLRTVLVVLGDLVSEKKNITIVDTM